MRLKERILAFVTCMALVFSLTACNAAPPTGGSSAVNSAKTATSTEKDYSEKQTITLATIQIQDGKDYTYGDEFTKYWADKFNIEWEITSLTWENWAERLRVWINSDDMPDMAVWNYLHGEAATYAEQGLVKKLPDDWKTSYPNLAKAYGDTVMNEGVEKALGGTYYMFRPVFSTNRPTKKLSAHTTLYARQDWADAIGFELKDAMKWSEILEYARQVKAKDPGKIGKNFYPLTVRSGNAHMIVQANSTYCGVGATPFYLGEDGKYQWGGAAEETLQGLKLYSQLYTEGLLHPEFYTLQDPDDQAAFSVTGKSAMCIREGMAASMKQMDSEMKTNQNVDYSKATRAITMLGEDGNYHYPAVTNYWCANVFSPNIEETKLTRLLDAMDYSCTKDGQDIIRMGIEGTDWEKGSDGKYISLLDESVILNDKYAIHPVYGNLMILSDDFQFISPNFKEEYRAKVKDMYLLREKLSTEKTLPSEPDWKVQFYSSTELNLASLNYTDEYAALVTQEGDIQENWKKWIDIKMKLIQPVLDDLNSEK